MSKCKNSIGNLKSGSLESEKYIQKLVLGENTELLYSSPILKWDYYKGVGAPKLDNLTDLLNLLKKIQEEYPQTPDGSEDEDIRCDGGSSFVFRIRREIVRKSD